MNVTTPATPPDSGQLQEDLDSRRSAQVRRTSRSVFAAVALVFAAASCGTATDQAASTDVATLSGDTDQVAEVETAEEQDTAEIALEFTQCMRDNGIDMDDPTFDADGNIEGGLGFGRGQAAGDANIDPRSEEFQTAIAACGSLIEDLDLGGGGNGGLDRTEIEEALLTYTACLRDEGLAVDDITIGGDRSQAAGAPPAGDQAADGAAGDGGGFAGGEPPAAGEERPQGAGGEGFDPTARLVEQLGLDQDDPDVAAALETCAPQLEAAFAGGTDATTEDS